MTLQKLFKLVPTLLILGIFGWTVFYIFSYDDYYYGEPLETLDVVVKDRPKFSFATETSSYYYFTTEEYKIEFRVSEGSVEIVRKRDSLTKAIEAIKSGDSITLEIRQKDNRKLTLQGGKIRGIGLSQKGKKIIDPKEVETIEKGNKADRWFGYCVFFGVLLFVIVRAYRKRKGRILPR